MYKIMSTLILLLPAIFLTGCTKNNTIVVGASSTPHAMILNQTKKYITSKGYNLEIKVFNDYVLPNFALENGELDGNYFQTEPYLNEFNQSNGTHIVSVLKVHFEPMGIYKGTKSTLDSYQSGDSIIVPSDKSNYDRALALLDANNIKDANIIEVEAQTIPLMLSDCAFAVVNGNYALSSNILNECLVTEDKESDIAETMGNVIAVKSGNETTNETQILCEALRQSNIKDYIEKTFKSSVIYLL